MGEEEGGTFDGAGRVWIVDPIDGTANYARAIPVWATLIALQVDGELVLGVASAPALGERYAAARGEGATMNGKRIRVSDTSRLADAQFLYSQLDTLLGGAQGSGDVGAAGHLEPRARVRGLLGASVGGPWRGGDLHRAVARDLGLRGARPDRRGGGRADHRLRRARPRATRAAWSPRTAPCTTTCFGASPADAALRARATRRPRDGRSRAPRWPRQRPGRRRRSGRRSSAAPETCGPRTSPAQIRPSSTARSA